MLGVMKYVASWLRDPLSNSFFIGSHVLVSLSRIGVGGGGAGVATTAANVFGALSSAWLLDVS